MLDWQEGKSAANLKYLKVIQHWLIIISNLGWVKKTVVWEEYLLY